MILGHHDAVDELLESEREESRLVKEIAALRDQLAALQERHRKMRAFLSHDENARYHALRTVR